MFCLVFWDEGLFLTSSCDTSANCNCASDLWVRDDMFDVVELDDDSRVVEGLLVDDGDDSFAYPDCEHSSCRCD